MTKILGISGSLRRGSYNTALLKAISSMMPEGSELEVATLHGIPLYDQDLEDEKGIPEAVTVLKDKIVAADGLLLATPEYNSAMPGVFKNAMDWLSRPTDDMKRVFGGRPTGIIGASPGAFGTILSQSTWLVVLRALGTQPFFSKTCYVSRAADAFDEAGGFKDEGTMSRVKDYMESYMDFVNRVKIE